MRNRQDRHVSLFEGHVCFLVYLECVVDGCRFLTKSSARYGTLSCSAAHMQGVMVVALMLNSWKIDGAFIRMHSHLKRLWSPG